jgi:hypothetical protein
MADLTVIPRVTRKQGVAPGHRRCLDCREAKPFSEFPTDKTTKSGLRCYCKPCNRLRRMARYYGSARVRIEHAERARLQNYGLSASKFTAMLCAQVGLCKACEVPMGPGVRQLHVDHCHATGRVRGLLCDGCNRALGHVKDSPERLRQLAAYLDACAAIADKLPSLAA